MSQIKKRREPTISLGLEGSRELSRSSSSRSQERSFILPFSLPRHSFPFPGRPPPNLQWPSSAKATCSGCSPAWGTSACSRRAPVASARWPCRRRCPVPRCHRRTPPSPLRRRGPGSSVRSAHSHHCGRGGGDGQWRVGTREGRHRRDFYGGGGGEVRHVMDAAMRCEQ